MKSITKIVLLLISVLILPNTFTSFALAQAEPKFTYPVAGSTVTGDIGVVRVGFDEVIDPALSGLELQNGEAVVSADGAGYGNCDALSCHLYLGHLEPDEYIVTYNVLTVSGKVLQNQFRFSVGEPN